MFWQFSRRSSSVKSSSGAVPTLRASAGIVRWIARVLRPVSARLVAVDHCGADSPCLLVRARRSCASSERCERCARRPSPRTVHVPRAGQRPQATFARSGGASRGGVRRVRAGISTARGSLHAHSPCRPQPLPGNRYPLA